MLCKLCGNAAVSSSPVLCKSHFLEYFEKKVSDTIKEYKLINKKDIVGVAVSGGKDSMSLLNVLHKKGYNVVALAIDEGIKGYRDIALENLKVFCQKKDIDLRIVSFKKAYKKTLDEILSKKKVRSCTVCGVLRRSLLNKYSSGFDVIATGHNRDDEAQAIIMNLVKGNYDALMRLGPVAGYSNKREFTKRVKPFYFCSEKECMIYSFLTELNVKYNECPYVEDAFRLKIGELLNNLESEKKGTKKNIVEWFLGLKKNTKKKEGSLFLCRYCKEPSSNEICNKCQILKIIK